MTDRQWASRSDPFASEADDGSYKPWRSNSGGMVRDLKFIPPDGSEDPVRYIPYMQAISIELHSDATQLALQCHSSEHVIFIEGRGLDELADNISAKRVQSIHIHSEAVHGPAPVQVVTAVRFRGSIADAEG